VSRYACVDDQKAAGFGGDRSVRGRGGVDVGLLRLEAPLRAPRDCSVVGCQWWCGG
jgi:hypothetical protein